MAMHIQVRDKSGQSWVPVDVMADLAASATPFLGGHAHEGMALAAEQLRLMHGYVCAGHTSLPPRNQARRLHDEPSLSTRCREIFGTSIVETVAVERRDRLAEALAPLLSQNYELHIIGHSLGAGVAVLLTLLLDLDPRFTGNVRCTAFSPPPVLSLDLARSSAALVDSFIVEDDIIPRLSIASINRLHDELAEYAWQVRLVYVRRQGSTPVRLPAYALCVDPMCDCVCLWGAASPSCTKSTEKRPRDSKAHSRLTECDCRVATTARRARRTSRGSCIPAHRQQKVRTCQL